jgi:limonene 1,2-monooxygenase
MAPFHRVGENPSLALERDLELIEWLDYLGYDEAWFGEHHSAGWEIIAAPELMIAAAGQRTKRIRLGTGVTSIPYHHPLMVADRMVQLDHMTRGRAMLGVGPGALSSDAYMMGIDPVSQRTRMDEGLTAIMRLFECREPVTMETDWFTLRDARLQLRPYGRELEVAVASSFSPAGMVSAGKHGVGVLAVSAFVIFGMIDLKEQWQIAEDAADEAGTTIGRDDWRIVVPFHLAESREQAIADVRDGALAFNVEYFQDTLGRPTDPLGAGVEAMIERGSALVGTPDDAIEGIKRIQEATGGFGVFLGLAHEWASRDKTRQSYELFARYVMPVFQGQLDPVRGSQQWVAENRNTIFATMPVAIAKAFEDAGRELPAALFAPPSQ